MKEAETEEERRARTALRCEILKFAHSLQRAAAAFFGPIEAELDRIKREQEASSKPGDVDPQI